MEMEREPSPKACINMGAGRGLSEVIGALKD